MGYDDRFPGGDELGDIPDAPGTECGECFALISPGQTRGHSAWHDRLGVVAHPGDCVLITVSEDTTAELAGQIIAAAKAIMPDVAVGVVGAQGVTVVRG